MILCWTTYFIAFSNVAQRFASRWVDGGKGFATDRIDELSVDEQLQTKTKKKKRKKNNKIANQRLS